MKSLPKVREGLRSLHSQEEKYIAVGTTLVLSDSKEPKMIRNLRGGWTIFTLETSNSM